MLERTHPVVGKVLAFPRTRRLSWTSLALEFGHQLVLALWIGTLVSIASLAVPSLLEATQDTSLGARVILDLLARISFLGCGAGCFLLLTTLLMQLVSIRSTQAALAQAVLILGMTGIATAAQLWLAPSLSTILRDHPDLFQNRSPSLELLHFRSGLTVYLSLLLTQAFLGAAQMLLGIRRWYRYIAVRSVRASAE